MKGYAALPLNEPGRRSLLNYGSYTLNLAEPPIFIQEYPEVPKMPIRIKISIVRANQGVAPT